MKIRHPALIRLAGFLLSIVLLVWLRTLRYRVIELEFGTQGDRQRGRERFIYALWHGTLLAPVYRFRHCDQHILISEHADGELITHALRPLGFRTVRGSTTRGGFRATREMIRTARAHDMVVMVDGPRGPRHRVKPGIVYLGAKTGSPIVPVGCAFSKTWRADSWDRTAIPKPGAVAVFVWCPSVAVPRRLRTDDLERYRLRIEGDLQRATARAERIAARHA